MFYDNFINQCVKFRVTPAKVAREIGVSGAAITKWKNGSKPTDVTVAKVADYFGVSVEEMLADSEEVFQQKKVSSDECLTEDKELNEMLEELKNNPGKRLLFSKTKSASKEDIEKIIAMVDILTGGKNYGGYYY